MRYLDKSFSTPANSRAYVEGWERVFGKDDAKQPEIEIVPAEPVQPATPKPASAGND